MSQEELLSVFINFGLAIALGLLIGTERSMSATDEAKSGLRDFTLIALIGAMSAYVATLYDNAWLVAAGFFGFIAMLVVAYWTGRKPNVADIGVTTEIAAIATFFIGVLAMSGQRVLAVALAIVIVAILSQKQALHSFRSQIQFFELQSTVKFLIITFIVLPLLPHRSLDNYLTYSVGEVAAIEQTAVEASGVALVFVPAANQVFEDGGRLELYGDSGFLGVLQIDSVTEERVAGRFDGKTEELGAGDSLYAPLAPMFMMHMLAALKPFKVWLIVVLVSFISFVGYILVKILGSGAGIGLTGLIGGLASSTVTTLSFAKRSKELPAWNQLFAVAILLASSIMFPRLLFQIGVFNQALMHKMAVPILVTGATGIVMAALFFLRAKKTTGENGKSEQMSLDNPFSLKSAIKFGLVFACILMLTRLAITYLGEAWLPVVAIVSGLTDADAIAFSLSDAQRSGLITLDWAAFNVVLGALSNTFVKLFFVYTLGHRELFKHMLLSILVMGAAGLITMLFYYDLGIAERLGL